MKSRPYAHQGSWLYQKIRDSDFQNAANLGRRAFEQHKLGKTYTSARSLSSNLGSVLRGEKTPSLKVLTILSDLLDISESEISEQYEMDYSKPIHQRSLKPPEICMGATIDMIGDLRKSGKITRITTRNLLDIAEVVNVLQDKVPGLEISEEQLLGILNKNTQEQDE